MPEVAIARPSAAPVSGSFPFWGILIPEAPWRQIAVASAIASIVGLALFAGTWPGRPNELESMLDTGVAMTTNVAILGTQLWLHWPAQATFGK